MQQKCTLCGEEIKGEEYLVVQTLIMPEGNGIVQYQHQGCADQFGKDVQEEML